MAWHENVKPSLERKRKRLLRNLFIRSIKKDGFSQEIIDKLIKSYDKGH